MTPAIGFKTLVRYISFLVIVGKERNDEKEKKGKNKKRERERDGAAATMAAGGGGGKIREKYYFKKLKKNIVFKKYNIVIQLLF